MVNNGDEIPYRVISRFLNEYQNRTNRHQLALFGGNPDHLAIFLLVWRVGLLGPKHISINAVASSLNRPYESVRRQVHRLVRENWLRLEPDGVTPADTDRVAAVQREFADGMLSRLVDLIARLNTFDVAVPSALIGRRLNGAPAIATGIDLQLISVELNQPQMPSLMVLNIAGAMLVRNIETVTHDPTLSREYAGLEQVPPTALRVPVKLTTIATVLSAPRVTVWRHVRSMIAAGIVAEAPEGYLVSPTWLASSATIDSAKAIADYMLRSLHVLAARLALDEVSAQ